MTCLTKIKKITHSKTVKKGLGFKELINKELMLGQSRFVCRWGTLSDGHDKITDAQRYYQAIREMYSLSNEMQINFARAMEAQADLLEAEELKEVSMCPKDTLRAMAKVLFAETKLENLYITIQDQSRMLDEYDRVRAELQDSVRAKYPEGIEQAELENWLAVAGSWIMKKAAGAPSAPLNHLPLPPDLKAKMGAESGASEMTTWYLLQNRQEIVEKYKGNAPQFLEDKLLIPQKG